MGCGVLEWGIYKVIGGQGIPINAVIKVCNGKGLLIRRYRRIPSMCPSISLRSMDKTQKQLVIHFT